MEYLPVPSGGDRADLAAVHRNKDACRKSGILSRFSPGRGAAAERLLAIGIESHPLPLGPGSARRPY